MTGLLNLKSQRYGHTFTSAVAMPTMARAVTYSRTRCTSKNYRLFRPNKMWSPPLFWFTDKVRLEQTFSSSRMEGCHGPHTSLQLAIQSTSWTKPSVAAPRGHQGPALMPHRLTLLSLSNNASLLRSNIACGLNQHFTLNGQEQALWAILLLTLSTPRTSSSFPMLPISKAPYSLLEHSFWI